MQPIASCTERFRNTIISEINSLTISRIFLRQTLPAKSHCLLQLGKFRQRIISIEVNKNLDAAFNSINEIYYRLFPLAATTHKETVISSY